jgi:hypothetical protein
MKREDSISMHGDHGDGRDCGKHSDGHRTWSCEQEMICQYRMAWTMI